MAKVVTFGEIMLRLSPPGYQRFIQAHSFDVVYGGGEANVAMSLATMGVDAAFVTRLPKNPIGEACRNQLRMLGVDTSMIAWGGERLGIYYCEKGVSMRPSNVVYDRAHASIATAQSGDFDWDAIFAGVTWFHFTGITPALGDNVAALCMEAVKAAKAHGVTVSCDLNYRKKLWSREKAGEVMGSLMPYVDVVIANEEDASDVFGIKADATDITGGKINHDGYKQVAKKLADRFNLKMVAITLRESHSASDNGWSAMLYDGSEYYFSKKYEIRLVDRVGGGDSFGAGLIYGGISGMSAADTLEFAVAASALKQTIEGDYNISTVAEIQKLAGGDASGRVQR